MRIECKSSEEIFFKDGPFGISEFSKPGPALKGNENRIESSVETSHGFYDCSKGFINKMLQRTTEVSRHPDSGLASPRQTTTQKQRTVSLKSDHNTRGSLTSHVHHIFLFYFLISPLLVSLLQWKHVIPPVTGCRPGPYSGSRQAPRKMTPLVFRQHIPNVSEKTIGASGPAEGKIMRNSKRFNEELITNVNSNIVFKDEERTSADRMMTERCKDRLNRLAIMVSEQWGKEKVKLRVTEAWDEDDAHTGNSLHYEGRAVDITTSDRDREKYGMLARLAVEAGFDWVYYESRSHVHCSVKADKSDAAIYGGCFSGTSYATRPDGRQIAISKLKPGDAVLTLDPAGTVVPDKIITFLHWTNPSIKNAYYFKRISVDSGESITVTSNHLIKVLTATNSSYKAEFVFAKDVRGTDYLVGLPSSTRNYTTAGNTALQRVISVDDVTSLTGVYAPLTSSGTILVNGMLSSCYAVIADHELAHFVLSPMRYFLTIKAWLYPETSNENAEGIPLYLKTLFSIASYIFSERFIYV